MLIPVTCEAPQMQMQRVSCDTCLLFQLFRSFEYMRLQLIHDLFQKLIAVHECYRCNTATQALTSGRAFSALPFAERGVAGVA